jgi:hypothetical protein
MTEPLALAPLPMEETSLELRRVIKQENERSYIHFSAYFKSEEQALLFSRELHQLVLGFQFPQRSREDTAEYMKKYLNVHDPHLGLITKPQSDPAP